MSAPQRRRVEASKNVPRMRKADRKRQLLAQAKHLFVTLGYQNTTTEKIARAAGVSEPVLYRHFESKKALFLEVLREIREATLMRWHTHTAQVTDPLTKLHAIINMYLGTTREHAVEFRIIHRTLIETNDEEIAAFLRLFYLDSQNLLAQVISDGQQTGVFRRSLDPARRRLGDYSHRTGLYADSPSGHPSLPRAGLHSAGGGLHAPLSAQDRRVIPNCLDLWGF